MDGLITEMLNQLDVTPETQARLDLFTQVPPPEDEDAFRDVTPVQVPMTVGQLNLLRGALRGSVQVLLAAQADDLMHAKAAGVTVQEYQEETLACGHDHSATTELRMYLDTWDRLTTVYADAQAEGDSEVPDTIPADWS